MGVGRGPSVTIARMILEEGSLPSEFFFACTGKWLTPFDPVFTEEDTFHLDRYKAVKVPMMYRAGKFASTFDKNFHCHILKLPYRGNTTMLVVLMEKMGDHLALEDYLTTDLVDTWLRSMTTRYRSPLTPRELSLPSLTHAPTILWYSAIPPVSCGPPRGRGFICPGFHPILHPHSAWLARSLSQHLQRSPSGLGAVTRVGCGLRSSHSGGRQTIS